MSDLTRIILIVVLIVLLVLYFYIRTTFLNATGKRISRKKIEKANVFFEQSVQFESEGSYKEAIKALDKAIKFNPEQFEYYFFRAIAQEKIGNVQKAIADYTAAITLKPGNAELYEHRKNIYKELGDLPEAYKDAKYITIINPENFSAYIERANIALLMKNKEIAIADLGQALKIATQMENKVMMRNISEKIKKLQA